MELQPFYIGQRVTSKYSVEPVKEGHEYIITGIKKGCCMKWIVTVQGIVSPTNSVVCAQCNTTFDKGYWMDYRLFAPIEEQFQSISFTEIMEKELVCVN